MQVFVPGEYPSRLGRQQDLAEVLMRVEIGMSLGCLFHREAAIDERLESAHADKPQDFRQGTLEQGLAIPEVPQVKAHDAAVLIHQGNRLEGGHLP